MYVAHSTNQGEVKPTMALLSKRPIWLLAEGLRRMEREGWQLIRIQAHHTTDGIFLQHAQNRYYPFKENNAKEAVRP
jgi:hypothetical protein